MKTGSRLEQKFLNLVNGNIKKPTANSQQVKCIAFKIRNDKDAYSTTSMQHTGDPNKTKGEKMQRSEGRNRTVIICGIPVLCGFQKNPQQIIRMNKLSLSNLPQRTPLHKSKMHFYTAAETENVI